MRRPRFRIRTLMVAVAVVALSSAAIVRLPYGHVEYTGLDSAQYVFDPIYFPPSPPWSPEARERLRALGIELDQMPNGPDAFAK